MSSTYNLEPPPTAKVLLRTTSGPILLELFAQQTPLASRNFLQHCLNGYYTSTLFHRVIPNFIIQGGDPSGTGSGGVPSINDGLPFADEFHSRLKFNRRGLLGMANSGLKNDNGSQFFITLGKTEELNGRNTLFGRVAMGPEEGDTIFNVLRIGEAELIEGTERPMYPVKVEGVEVLVNPFGDMKIAPTISEKLGGEGEKKKVTKKKIGKKTLLSFGVDEGEEEEGETVTKMKKKVKYNPKIVRGGEGDEISIVEKDRLKKDLSSIRTIKERHVSPDVTDAIPTPAPITTNTRSPSSSPEPSRNQTRLDRTNAQIASLKASMRRGTTDPVPTITTQPKSKKSALEKMIPSTSIRGRKRRNGGPPGITGHGIRSNNGGGGNGNGNGMVVGEDDDDDKKALDLFNAFKSKLDSPSSGSRLLPDPDSIRTMAPSSLNPAHGKEKNGGDDDNSMSKKKKKKSSSIHIQADDGDEEKRRFVKEDGLHHGSHRGHSRSQSRAEDSKDADSNRPSNTDMDMDVHEDSEDSQSHFRSGSRTSNNVTGAGGTSGGNSQGNGHEKPRGSSNSNFFDKGKRFQGGVGADQGDFQTNSNMANHAPDDEEEEEEAKTCDLHFIIDCPSCSIWEKN
ncbi:MAG: subunit of the Arp2/3 complex [Watsoniomyces obsoletus]|nr:MAG: subunit of the Arp2/3 complex [Watsoniomyces obsoletus]